MAININQDIGKNGFKLKHLIWSNTAKNNGINNMPGIDDSPSTDEIIKNLNDLANNVIDPILEIYPNLIITSGYRCVKLNKILGGSNTSQHIFGQAVDLKVPQLTTADLYNWIYSNIKSYETMTNKYLTEKFTKYFNDPVKAIELLEFLKNERKFEHKVSLKRN